MSFWSWFTSDKIKADEAYVLNLLVKIKAGAQVAEADAEAAAKWLTDNSGTIAQDVAIVTGLIIRLGLAGHPEIAAAITAANVAVAALNAFAAADAAGGNIVPALLSGYEAVKQAQAAHAQAGLAVAATVK